MKMLFFTVTNDLSYDQRMIRICSSLSAAGYRVRLIGRKLPDSIPLTAQPFEQTRLPCLFQTGALFYAEFNIRLFIYLLVKRHDCICAIDLDTILPCYLSSILKKTPRVYDAHELFCEMQEIVERPSIYRVWKWIERKTVPRFRNGYTVNQPIADEFHRMYGVSYQVISNMAVLRSLTIPAKPAKYILYQGAVNEGRSFNTLIPAMKLVNARLIICGDGNYMEQAKQLVRENGLDEKIHFTGKLNPDELRTYTIGAWVGVTLFESKGKSNYFSLANRFFDYLHAGVPQVCVNYPVYSALNNDAPFAVLIEDLQPATIAGAINILLTNHELYHKLQQNALTARQKLNWGTEETKLVNFYKSIT